MQPVPEGYKPLGFAGFTDKGTYTASEVYAKNDIVHNNNTTWRCLVNGTTGIIPAEGANWTIFIASESDSSGITTTDTEGLVGPAGEKVSNQSLIDAIAEKVAKQLVTNASLTNALAGYITKEMMSSDQTDDPDKVPTSALAYAMQQSIDELNGNLKWKNVDASTWSVISGGEIKLAEYNLATKEMHIIFSYTGTEGISNGITLFAVPNEYTPAQSSLGIILYTFERVEKTPFYASVVTMRNKKDIYALYVGEGKTYNHRFDIRYNVI